MEIFVRDRNVRVKYRVNNLEKEFEWEDYQDLAQRFLARLDKINNCNKNDINCLFSLKLDTTKSPTEFSLKRAGSESTTWRIVFISLKALEWTGKIKLSTSTKS
jgi:hypothetical protein